MAKREFLIEKRELFVLSAYSNFDLSKPSNAMPGLNSHIELSFCADRSEMVQTRVINVVEKLSMCGTLKVHPARIELASSEPESDILSIELRVR